MNSLSLLFLSLCILLLACNNQSRAPEIEVSDTVNVFFAALLRGTDNRHMPSIDLLFKNRQHQDTVYFTTRALPLELLPDNIMGILIKKINPDSICLILNKIVNGNPRNYLDLERFENSDTGYYAQIGNLNCENLEEVV